MSWITFKEKQEQRAKLIHDAGELLKTAKKEERELTPDEKHSLRADAHRRRSACQRSRATTKTRSGRAKSRSTYRPRTSRSTSAGKSRDIDATFRRWICGGKDALNPKNGLRSPAHRREACGIGHERRYFWCRC